jgi:hypothetical protein
MAKRYCAFAASAALLMLFFIAAFNAVVDPYGMYRLCRIEGFNVLKPAIYHRVRLFKAYDVRRIKPSAIVLGSSRSHLGIRVTHEGWDPTATPRYNLAFDGATTKEMYFYLRHAYSIHPLKQVVLGLDTYHPMQAPSSTRPDFNPQLLCRQRSMICALKMALEDLKLLASTDTLRASIVTLRSQNSGEPEWFAADGQRVGELFFRQVEGNFRECPRTYFEKTDEMEVGFKLEGRSLPSDKNIHQVSATPHTELYGETSLGYIKRIIEFCRDRGIDLRLFITPEHAHQMEISAEIGQWSSIEKGKRDLVDLLAQDAAKHPGAPQIPLYDFSGYNSVTTEDLPDVGSKAEMKYYWESSHFKEIVGDFVLDRLFGVSHLTRPVPPDFGVQLTVDTVDSALDRIRLERISYRMKHPQDVARIRSLVEDFLHRNRKI